VGGGRATRIEGAETRRHRAERRWEPLATSLVDTSVCVRSSQLTCARATQLSGEWRARTRCALYADCVSCRRPASRCLPLPSHSLVCEASTPPVRLCASCRRCVRPRRRSLDQAEWCAARSAVASDAEAGRCDAYAWMRGPLLHQVAPARRTRRPYSTCFVVSAASRRTTPPSPPTVGGAGQNPRLRIK